MKLNKLILGIAAAAAFSTTSSFAGDTLALWTFEGLSSTTAPPASGILADSGVKAATSSASVNTGGTLSSPAGSGSARSYSSNGWDVGEYFQFTTSTTNYSGISLSWNQTGSNTGPKNFTLSYSTDGSSFTNFANYSLTTVFTTLYTQDLSALTVLNNVPTVYFRLVDNSTTSINNTVVAAGGTDRVDNFQILSAVPEPTTYGVIIGSMLVALVVIRRRNARLS